MIGNDAGQAYDRNAGLQIELRKDHGFYFVQNRVAHQAPESSILKFHWPSQFHHTGPSMMAKAGPRWNFLGTITGGAH